MLLRSFTGVLLVLERSFEGNMKVGDLVKLRNHEQYGIIQQVLQFHEHAALYAVVFWSCGNRTGLYTTCLEVINESR